MIAVGGFHPHWVSTFYLVFMCMTVYFVFTAPCYYLYGSDAHFKDQHIFIYNFKATVNPHTKFLYENTLFVGQWTYLDAMI